MNYRKKLYLILVLILEITIAPSFITQAFSIGPTSSSNSLVLKVTSDQDDAAVASLLDGTKFMNYIGYPFIMITRGDLPVVIKGGYRFLNAPISQGSFIKSAKLMLNLYMSRRTPSSPNVPLPPGHSVSVFAQATGNAPVFINDANDFLARPGTTARVTWTLPAGTVVGEWMEVDITPVLQEIVGRSDWTQGNAIAIFTEYTTPNSNYYNIRSCSAMSPYPAQLIITYASTGTLNIDTSPVKGEVFVNGTSWGIAPQTSIVAAGTYMVSFGEVLGYLTPTSQTVQVNVDNTTGVIGEYVTNLFNVTRDVTSAMDDVSYAYNPSTGFSFYETMGYNFNMITRGDVKVAIKGGYRFLDIAVPKGKNIQSARVRLCLQMSRRYVSSPDVPLPMGYVVQVYAQATGDAPPFTLDKNDFLARPGTTARVTWTLPAGTVVGEWMEVDITPVLQEIVGRSDWTQGNAIAIFTEYTTVNPAYYIVHCYEGGTTLYPTELIITYTY